MRKAGSGKWATLIGAVAIAMASAPAVAQECEVKLGVAGPLTGGGVAWGLALKGGTEFEAAWTNANGGVPVGERKCKVTVSSVDTLQTAAGGAAASNTLASQNVRLMVGPVSGPENAGWKPVAKRNGQLYFTTTFALDAIGPDFPLAFQNQLPPQAWAPAYLDRAKQQFPMKTLVLVGPNDQGGTDPGKALLKFYEDAGIKGSPEWYQRGTMNFAPLATRIMAQNPDVVELGPMPPGEATILVRQLTEAGYKGVIGRSGAGAEQIIKGLGGADKVTNMFSWETVPTEDPGIVQMRADYERLMKAPVPENSLVYSAQITAEQILRAVTRAGTADDVQKVRAALLSSDPESRYLGKGGWRGKTMYRSNQQLAFPIGMGLIVSGKQQKQVRIDIPFESP